MADAVINAIKSRFDEFFEMYYRKDIDDLIIAFPHKRSLGVDFNNLAKFDPDLANELVNKPDIVLEAATESLRGKMGEVRFEDNEVHPRFFGQGMNVPLVQDVGAGYIGKLILLDSLIVKRSEISPKAKIDTYRCTSCGSVSKFRADKDDVMDACPECKRKTLKHDPDQSVFVNLQKIAVQDPLEKLKGNVPSWQMEVWLEDDLVNTVIPGDIIELTGVLRIRPRKNARGKNEGNLYTMFIETVSIVPKQKEFAELSITEDEERQIKELSKDPKIFEKIWRSIAASIYGHDEIKQAVALQLFGGTPGKALVDGGPIRSDMHILLIGDPGSAKTRILQSVTRLVPKGIYVSGKSVTGGGMTAVAERDEFSEGGWTLKAGALVLGNGGTVAIDEFDKIGDEDRASLHEALESQTISVAKAGIIATFNAKTSVLAAANPKLGRFDVHQYPASQFNIEPTLLSRFDLIFPIRDELDPERDRNIAKHILIQHQAAGAALADAHDYEQVEKPQIDSELLRKYIAYAKRNVMPRLGAEAAKKIEEYYVGLRTVGISEGGVPITARQIEGLVRMAEASAKTRLATTVEASDAKLAIELIEFMLKTLAVDTNKRTDIDRIFTGIPREKVERMNLIIELIKKLDYENNKAGARYEGVIEKAMESGLDRQTVERIIEELQKTGDIYTPHAGLLKISRSEPSE